jgi:hypothetical protein
VRLRPHSSPAVELLLQLAAADALLFAPLGDQLPELFVAAEFQLFRVHAFDAHNKGNGLAVPHDDNALLLGLADARFQVGLAKNSLLHRVFSVVRGGGLYATALDLGMSRKY